MTRVFEAAWKCAGCGSLVPFRVEVDERALDRSFHPAVLIAEQRNKMAKDAAERHARQGCSRPC